MHYIYMLKCKDNTFYTGYTNNLEKRLKAHNEGKGAKYTRGRGPVELIYYEEYEDKHSAMRREWEIKRLTRSEKETMRREWERKQKMQSDKDAIWQAKESRQDIKSQTGGKSNEQK